MAVLPITLAGNNLGERHKYLNQIVNETFKNNIPFESLQIIPELSAVDRLFKIDLAAKYRNVNYIIQNLKDEDILYVSRAMKCTWLITDEKYIDIINPVNLEQHLYPDMRTNATNKMKFWILQNLKHEYRNEQFYEYYKNIDNDYALKFLPKCSQTYLIHEIELIPVDKIKPQFLKLLCEKSTKAAEKYFKNLIKSGDTNESYMAKMQILLKTDPETYFYVIENFFLDDFKRLNQKVTRYIMKHHRNRFNAKPELYTVRVLNMQMLAKILSSEEIKELIIKLARTQYMGHDHRNWFDYEFAKPLIKAIDPKERSKFCTSIFKQKQFGEPVKDAPYLIPKRPERDNSRYHDYSHNLDGDNENYDKCLEGPPQQVLCCGGGGRGLKWPTELDKLYDEYRFKSFENTFADLKKRILKESKMAIRQNMMLVLISKTGGRTESVNVLLQYFIKKHLNEPVNLRAAIVRSFVKRSFAWRWPLENWNLLLQFGHDLGLDGNSSEVPCIEGLHGVILRHIFLNETLQPAAWDAFLKDFSSLTDYKLNSSERRILHERLPAMVLSSTTNDPEAYIKILTTVCDALDAYKINVGKYPGVVDAIATFARKHPSTARALLLRLFKNCVGRKLLFKENFNIIQTDESYLNALRHDASILSHEKFEELLINIKNLKHDLFLRKLALYFGEPEGLASRYMEVLERKAAEQPHVKLARPMALLTGSHHISWPKLIAPKDDDQQQKFRKMVASLQSNSHFARNKLPMLLESKNVNLTALANWIHTSSPRALRNGMNTLIAYPRHARLVLALRATASEGLIAETLPHAAKTRPIRALRLTLRLLRKHPKVFMPQDFESLKSLVSTVNLNGKSFECYCDLVRLNEIPKSFRAAYSVTLYQNLIKIGFGPNMKSKTSVYYRIAAPLIMCIKNHIDEIEPEIVTAILKEFLDNVFICKVVRQFGAGDVRFESGMGYFDFRKYVQKFMKLIGRYLVTGKSEEDSKDRLQEIYEPFEQKLREMWNIDEVNRCSSFGFGYFETFLTSLQYSKVFASEIDFSLPVLERVCVFGDEVAPIINNFPLNQRIRFVPLFRQAIKLCLQKNIDIQNSDNYKILFKMFGKVIAEDIEDLVSKHFASIRLFYTSTLLLFLRTHFSRTRLETIDPVMKGLFIDETKPNAMVIGLSLYNRNLESYDRKDVDKDIEDSLKNSIFEEIKFYAEYTDYRFGYII